MFQPVFVVLLVTVSGLLVQARDPQSTQRDLDQLNQALSDLKEPLNRFSPHLHLNGSIEEVSKGYQELYDAFRSFEKKEGEALQQKLARFEERYGTSEKEIDDKILQDLGNPPRQRASYLWSEVKKGLEALKRYPRDMSSHLLDLAKRDLEHVSSLNPTIRGKKYDQIKGFLTLALKFDEDNQEAKTLLNGIDQQKKEELSAIEKAIDEREWAPHSEKFNGPGNPDRLAREVIKFLEQDEETAKGSILAVRLSGDWRVAEKTITGAPLTYGLPVHVAYRLTKDPKTASVQSLTIVTRDNEKGPPFKTYWVGDSWRVRSEKIISRSFGPSFLTRLVLVLSLLGCGLMAADPWIRTKVAGLTPILGALTPFRGVVGVTSFIIGGVLLVFNLFHPLADLLPQLLAITTGMILGRELLVKRASASPPPVPSMAPPPLPGEAASVPPLPPPLPETPSGPSPKNIQERTRDVWSQGTEWIAALIPFEVGMGRFCLLFGVVHLLLGGLPLV
jgi:hypothetical protein